MAKSNSVVSLVAQKVREAQELAASGEAAKLQTLTLRVTGETFKSLQELCDLLGGQAKPSAMAGELLTVAVMDGLKEVRRRISPSQGDET